ncbi:MAG TPA: hypothetical protein VLL54_08550 [Pyrinomonadaceae bacterium]|nr:hypothetical protein [Pyrinomonadaceae bacterium]
MQNRFLRYTACLLGVVMFVGLCFVDAGAQSRRRRRSRRTTKKVVRPVITNPVIAPPGSEQAAGADGEKIISTADQPAETTQTGEDTTKAKETTKPSGAGEMQQTINALSNQVDRLNEKLNQMQETERSRLDMERLTQAETRAESLRSQQLDVESKLADLTSRLELIEYQLKPENIERAAGYGTTHPEEARDSRKRQLENERTRVQAQIKILQTSQVRLEDSVRSADAEVDSLRRKIEMQQSNPDASGSTSSEPRRKAKPE